MIPWAFLRNRFDEDMNVFHGSLRENTMAEVEHVALPLTKLFQHEAYAFAHRIGVGEKNCGIEVSLEPCLLSHCAPRVTDVRRPIHTHHISRTTNFRERVAAPFRENNDGDTE